jgi:hypothetical protein
MRGDKVMEDGYLVSRERATSYELLVGKPVIIQTVLWIYTGLLKQVTDSDLVIWDQARIYATGRWSDAVAGKFGDSAEIEAYPDDLPSVIERGTVIECVRFLGALPRVTR